MALLHSVVITASVTYSQLLTLIQNQTLQPGHYYQITDYRTIYVQPVTGTLLGGSASPVPSKPFPLIVQAIDSSHLSHDAHAVPTVDYPYADKWRIKYDVNLPVVFQVFAAIDWGSVTTGQVSNCITVLNSYWGDSGADSLTTAAQMQNYIDTTFKTNQGYATIFEAESNFYQSYSTFNFTPVNLPSTTSPTSTYNAKYTWADATSIGVIYEMVDEFENRCGYDFKNVRFARYHSQSYTGISTWLNGLYYEFQPGSHAVTGSLDHFYTFNVNPTNTIGGNQDNSQQSYGTAGQAVGAVNNNWMSSYYAQVSDPVGLSTAQVLNNNVFLCLTGVDCDQMTLEAGTFNNTFGNTYRNNKFGASSNGNKMGDQLFDNVFGSNFNGNVLNALASNNIFGNDCFGNVIGQQMQNNTMGNQFYNNTVDQGCYGNKFGEVCSGNTIGQGCAGNNIGSSFGNNTIGNNFSNNRVDTAFGTNTMSVNCSNNVFGPNFINNVIQSPGNFQVNVFGPSCSSNTFGGNVQGNTFGSNFQNNTLGSSCSSNSFGNGVSQIRMGNSLTYNVFENNVNLIQTPINSTNGFSSCRFGPTVSKINFADVHFAFVEFKSFVNTLIDLTNPSHPFYTHVSGVVNSTVLVQEDGRAMLTWLGANGSTQVLQLFP